MEDEQMQEELMDVDDKNDKKYCLTKIKNKNPILFYSLIVCAIIILIIVIIIIIFINFKKTLPEGFVYIDEIDSSIKVNLKYFTSDNFIGERVPHYKKNRGIMTKEAATALSKAQKKFSEFGYSIVLYDSYRPDSSVKYFVQWMNDPNDQKRKKYHYPYIEKKSDMANIYIAERSGHSHGSTVDISLIKNGDELLEISKYEERVFNDKIYPFNNDNTIDCGTSFDLMDPASWAVNNTFNFTEKQFENRKLIKDVMESVGFKVLEEEWWHFSLINEPFPKTFFDFDIE